MSENEPMKNPALLFTVLLLIGCGKSEDKPEVKSSGKDSASAKETDGNGDSKKTKVPKNPPSKTNSKSGTRTIPTRRVPTRSVPAKKTEKHADKKHLKREPMTIHHFSSGPTVAPDFPWHEQRM